MAAIAIVVGQYLDSDLVGYFVHPVNVNTSPG
jgi:hypothetical protein